MNPQEFDRALAQQIGRFYNDPLGFVMFAYPWGKAGTPLENFTAGPDLWHRELFAALAEHVTANMARRDARTDMDAWWSAVASGHGVGKSTLVAWIIQWLMATRIDMRGVVTANTENQLTTKTWPELAKWHEMSIVKHWFKWTATQYSYAFYPESKRKNYCFDAIPWSQEKTEGFAGLHNAASAVAFIFDEASAIPDALKEVAEGGMTDGEAFMFAFGNPTRTSGWFYDCFHRHRALWRTWNVDSRSVRITNKTLIDRLISQYGLDSDVVRYRVRGQFPYGSANGYIPLDLVEQARVREVTKDTGAGLVMGVDIARFGDDQTVFAFRRGRDARSIPILTFRNLDSIQCASKIAEVARHYKPDVVVVEGAGVGAGVVDMLKMWKFRIHEFIPGGKPNDGRDYFNRRAEVWGLMREWLRSSAPALPDDQELADDLTKIEYRFDEEGRLRLESKPDMKKRGLPSPDKGDAYAMTFAVPVQRRDARAGQFAGKSDRVARNVDYDLFA